MPDWQERITSDTPPAIRVEHELRYAAAMALVRERATWCDLGCGNGIAAATALGGAFDGRVVLVDLDEEAVERARTAVDAREVAAFPADLTSSDDLARVRTELLAGAPDGGRCVTCFEVVEHLPTFEPLVELLVELAAEHDTSVLASVPNDAFWAIENPHHATKWGEGAMEELRSLLPADHVLVQQVPLQGSALVREGGATEEVTSVSLREGVPSHFLLAFGPGAEAFAAAPRVVQLELEEQRRWERQRESDLAFAVARIRALEAEVAYLRSHSGSRRGRAAREAHDDAS
ncbi:MAG TPA: class I SAM-dependent methyltransferase [Conexibacter sp.]